MNFNRFEIDLISTYEELHFRSTQKEICNKKGAIPNGIQKENEKEQ